MGFEIGDLETGAKLARVEVQGFAKGPVKRHGCPSHGIGLTPDERELWVADAANRRVHVFDATAMPPKQQASIELRDEPGWVTFTIDGQYAYPSTGDVIDVKSRTIVATLADEERRPVHEREDDGDRHPRRPRHARGQSVRHRPRPLIRRASEGALKNTVPFHR